VIVASLRLPHCAAGSSAAAASLVARASPPRPLYVFIGLISVLLVGIFFLLAGVLTLLSASAYLVELSLDDILDEGQVLANGVVAELAETAAGASIDLEQYRRVLAARHPRAILALVGVTEPVRGAASFSGSWTHELAQNLWPEWAEADRFATLVVSEHDRVPRIVARARQRVSSARRSLVSSSIFRWGTSRRCESSRRPASS